MDVRAALFDKASDAGWSMARIAVCANLGEAAIRKLKHGGTANVNGSALLALMRELPGFAEAIGFEPISRKGDA